MFWIWMRLGFFLKTQQGKHFILKAKIVQGENVRKRELLWHCVAVQPVKSFRHSSSERLKIRGASTKSTKVSYLSNIIQTVRPGWQDKFSMTGPPSNWTLKCNRWISDWQWWWWWQRWWQRWWECLYNFRCKCNDWETRILTKSGRAPQDIV